MLPCTRCWSSEGSLRILLSFEDTKTMGLYLAFQRCEASKLLLTALANAFLVWFTIGSFQWHFGRPWWLERVFDGLASETLASFTTNSVIVEPVITSFGAPQRFLCICSLTFLDTCAAALFMECRFTAPWKEAAPSIFCDHFFGPPLQEIFDQGDERHFIKQLSMHSYSCFPDYGVAPYVTFKSLTQHAVSYPV